MHPYSTDSSERKWIPVLILIVSILVALVLKNWWETTQFVGLLTQLHLVIGLLIDFSAIFFYEIFDYAFDKWLWKFSSFIPFMNVPDLNGKWEGNLNSSFKDKIDGDLINVKATIQITQTWQEIEIRLKTDKSKSKTVTAAFFTKNPNAIELSYQYQSDPEPNSVKSMHTHKGTGWVTLAPNMNSFEGGYYNGRDSKNHGSLKFEKKYSN